MSQWSARGSSLMSEAKRAVQAPRGPSSRSSARHSASGSVETRRAEVDQRAAGLGQGEDLGGRAAAAPAPARAQAARVGDRGVARLGGHSLGAWRGRRRGGVPRSAAGRSSAIGATVALARIRSVAGRHREDRRRQAGRRPHDLVAAEVRIHDHPRPAARRPIGGMPPMANPVRSWASRAVARRMSGAPVTAASRARSTRLGPETRHRTGSSPAVARDDEHERLDDLAELRADRRGRLGRGVGRLVEGHDLERHALAGGGIEDALDRGVDGGVGHGPESSIGPAAGRGRSA